jgi:uncharacterized protein YxjI
MLDKNKYVVRKKILAFLGQEVEVFDESGKVVLFAKQKAFKLREKLDIFTDSNKTELVMAVQARNIIDFHGTYDITDNSGKKIGALRRQGFKSILKDEWDVLDVNDNVIAVLSEDRMIMALLRRFLSNLIPQDYSITVSEKEVVDLKQDFNPFVYKLNIDIKENVLDTRVVIVSAILLAIIEGSQE